MSIDAMKQALAALEQYTNVVTSVNDPNSWVTVADGGKPARDAITALRAAIEHYDQTSLELCEKCGWKALIPGDGCLVCARQKPVAWVYPEFWDHLKQVNCGTAYCLPDEGMQPLYTAPREWVGLTDEEKRQIVLDDPIDWIDAVEAKLKEKNA